MYIYIYIYTCTYIYIYIHTYIMSINKYKMNEDGVAGPAPPDGSEVYCM